MSLIKISKKNKIYFNTLIKFILPLIIHDLVVNLFSYVDLLMVGQLGDTAVAAVGICNQIYTIFILLVFGIYSGVSIFIAQYNGEENILNIKKMLGISIVFSFFISLLFGLLAIIIPDKILSIYTNDPAVIETGSVYLRLIGFSLIFLSIYFSYSMALKSIGNTRIPMIIGVISILLNTGLNFILIFGFYSIPALGVAGAGIATLISRIVGFILLIAVIYIKKYVIAAHIKEIFSFQIKLVKQFLKVA
ncbi:MAG: polysaccharide biosynthesis C-terminal domain-containing protein, partial [Spirochaetales bacterium]|nr:polysaccharide biosynthesis C-terminal domain-containing protein [Spirochaetales bacterium]